ncbi:hypothetical protein NMG60_11037449 [Bertholletia excelsa]
MESQKIVIGMQLSSHKDKSKALKIASLARGVTSVVLKEGEVVVEGEGVDSIQLLTSMRKKVSRHASLVSVEEVKKKDPADELFEAMKKSYYYPYYQPPPPPYVYSSMYDPNPSCSIM